MKKDLTLIIPAKEEAISLPKVLAELNNFKVKKIIILDKKDKVTIKAIKDFKCEIIMQKKNGYGGAIIEGIKKSKTKYLCIFNADGSFDPKYLSLMLNKIKFNESFVFASRYIGSGGSEDDTLLTFVGNKIFTLLGNILFNLGLSDILFTYVMGNTNKFKKLKLKNLDFRICIEIPIKIKKNNFKYSSIPSFERKRFGGVKKVKEFKDGFLILLELVKNYFATYARN